MDDESVWRRQNLTLPFDLLQDEVIAMLASSIEESLAYRQIKAEGVVEGTQDMVVRQLRQRLGMEGRLNGFNTLNGYRSNNLINSRSHY